MKSELRIATTGFVGTTTREEPSAYRCACGCQSKVTTTVPSPLSQTRKVTEPAAQHPSSVLTEAEKLEIARNVMTPVAPPSLEAAIKQQREPSKTRTETLREFLAPTPVK